MNSEEYKSLKENADILKENALAKCNLEVNKARNYYEGYLGSNEVREKKLRFGGDYAYRRLQRKE